MVRSGYFAVRAVFLSVVVRPKMLSIMAGMNQKTVTRRVFVVVSGSGMCEATIAGFMRLVMCSLLFRQA